jgi:excisionase family DNA binding protein
VFSLFIRGTRFHGTIAVVEDEVLSVDEAAAWLKVDAVTVQRLLREGRLPGHKIGPRQWRISADALKAYVECDQNPKGD